MKASLETLCLVIALVCAYLELNHAATKVLYEFHIREAHSERNETGALRTGEPKLEPELEPELIITGKRTSSVVLPGKDANSPNSLYKETAVYTADDSGYHVTYNISIEPLELDTRLSGKALKVIVG